MAAVVSDDKRASAPPQIERRRFDRPQRNSAAQLATLQGDLRKVLPDVVRELSFLLRSPPRMNVTEVSEVDVSDLHQSLTPDVCALRFEAGGHPGWLLWNCPAVLSALETALGATTATAGAARALSTIERAMFLRMMSGPATKLARALGVEASNFVFAPDVDTFGHWRQGGERAEPRRLLAVVEFDAANTTSSWKLYLPGVATPSKPPLAAQPVAALPRNLEDVALDIVARLGSGEVPLSELLALEIGDVIPLECAVGDELEIVVEDHACLRGTLGRTQDKLAVRITGTDATESAR